MHTLQTSFLNVEMKKGDICRPCDDSITLLQKLLNDCQSIHCTEFFTEGNVTGCIDEVFLYHTETFFTQILLDVTFGRLTD